MTFNYEPMSHNPIVTFFIFTNERKQNIKTERLNRHCKIRKQISRRENHTALHIKCKRKNRDALMENSTHCSFTSLVLI